MSAPVIPDWLALPLLNVKMAALGKAPDELRWQADAQLIRAIETRIETARQEAPVTRSAGGTK